MQAQKLGWEAVLQRGQHKQRLCDSNVCLSPSVLGSEVGEEGQSPTGSWSKTGLTLTSLKKVLALSVLERLEGLLEETK